MSQTHFNPEYIPFNPVHIWETLGQIFQHRCIVQISILQLVGYCAPCDCSSCSCCSLSKRSLAAASMAKLQFILYSAHSWFVIGISGDSSNAWCASTHVVSTNAIFSRAQDWLFSTTLVIPCNENLWRNPTTCWLSISRWSTCDVILYAVTRCHPSPFQLLAFSFCWHVVYGPGRNHEPAVLSPMPCTPSHFRTLPHNYFFKLFTKRKFIFNTGPGTTDFWS